ncbi:hypothetical protein NDU88_001409 [Pleurodeles waltl]|uniref:Endonuclease/exonuclease/phosphatase domain-containing protein n=1 Tax=Pleurodeles waltl TaxID=8319 RepID=A0AAV7USP9_PLEWA|nr:hypothetical protein NDU88_001409 [Pleurodeles waltl]
MGTTEYHPTQARKTLAILSWNVAGLRSICKSGAATSYLNSNDIICMQDTWKCVPFLLPGYYEIFKSATCPSIFGRPSGGLSTFIKYAVLLVTTELTIESKMAQVITISVVSIDQQNVNLIIINCYINAPSKSTAELILELLKSLEMVIYRHPGHKIIMMSDFNIQGLDAKTEDFPLDRGRQLFLNFFTTSSLTSAQQEQKDNRIGCPLPSSIKCGSTIDYVYLSEKLKQRVSYFEITERGESDHNPLKCTIELQAQAAEQQVVVGISTGTEQVYLVRRIKWRPEDASKITLWLSAQPQTATRSLEWWTKSVDDLHKQLLCNLRYTQATLPAQRGTIRHMDNNLLGKRRALRRALRRQKQKSTPDTVVQVSNSRSSNKKLAWEHKREKDRKEWGTLFHLLKDSNHARF